jgi:sortase (surface protein transpeptidase)
MPMAFHRRRLALDALTAILAVGGLTLVVVGGAAPAEPGHGTGAMPAVEGPPAPSTPSRTPSSPSGRPPAVGRDTAGRPALGPSVPVHLDIPAIRVSTPLMALGLEPDGTIGVPPLTRGAPAGWYRYLSTPGEVGPAVILGHVDTARDGPAVFYRLREVHPGDTVTVRRLDGSTAVFTVNQVAEYPKSAFPADAVYGPLAYPALRLITCGGPFDRVHGEYRGNVVVYAALTSTTPASQPVPANR